MAQHRFLSQGKGNIMNFLCMILSFMIYFLTYQTHFDKMLHKVNHLLQMQQQNTSFIIIIDYLRYKHKMHHILQFTSCLKRFLINIGHTH